MRNIFLDISKAFDKVQHKGYMIAQGTLHVKQDRVEDISHISDDNLTRLETKLRSTCKYHSKNLME